MNNLPDCGTMTVKKQLGQMSSSTSEHEEWSTYKSGYTFPPLSYVLLLHFMSTAHVVLQN